MASCLNLTFALQQAGLEHDWNLGHNESLIHRARNAMTRAFLEGEPKHSHMMWLDADIVFTPGDVAAIWNMCEGPLNADIAVGVYAMKKRDEQWLAAWVNGALVKDLDQYGSEPIEVDFAGTGFMMIKRHVIEDLTCKVGTYAVNGGKRDPKLYMADVYDDYLESEDYHFCRIAREHGYKVWMDPTVRLGHLGQYCFGINKQTIVLKHGAA